MANALIGKDLHTKIEGYNVTIAGEVSHSDERGRGW